MVRNPLIPPRLLDAQRYYFQQEIFDRWDGDTDDKTASDFRPLWKRAYLKAADWHRRANIIFDHNSGAWVDRRQPGAGR